MHRRSLIAATALLTAGAWATPEQATKIQNDWQTAIMAWSEKATQALSAEEGAAVVASRPKAEDYARNMWKVIGGSLNQEWTLEPASWFLLITQGILAQPAPGIDSPRGNEGIVQPLFAKEVASVKEAVLAHHINSKHLVPMCMALARLGDPASLSILEKINESNPDPKIQGVAAMAAAVVLKTLGDNPDLMRKRLTYLRKAIIESADVAIGQTTIANLAENELYQIRYLSKGRVAPDLAGSDSAGKPIQLSDFDGKVVVLVFWSSTMPQIGHTLEFTSEMVRKFADKPIVVLGVNHDPLPKLRSMIADESVTWRNFSDPEQKLAQAYRVGILPMTYVLDRQRKIQYAGNLSTFAELTADALATE